MSLDLEAPGERESGSEDEPPQLSEYALTALQEFYQEQGAREQELQSRLAEGSAGHVHLEEDWVCTYSVRASETGKIAVFANKSCRNPVCYYTNVWLYIDPQEHCSRYIWL